MKVIVYEKPDGGVAVCRPCYNDPVVKSLMLVDPPTKDGGEATIRPFTQNEILDFVIRKDVPEGVRYKVIEETDLVMPDRSTRKDWKYCENRGIKLNKQ